MILLILCGILGLASSIQPLPPVQWTNNGTSTQGYLLSKSPRNIYIDSKFAATRDTEGLTLIPPSAHEFAETFRTDISSLFDGNWTLEQVTELPHTGIFLGPFRGDASQLTYENGVVTEEGYELEVTADRIYIGGSGARGMFWGTRTLLQELLIANGTTLGPGRIVDAPAYATRGYMLDAGRKW